MSRFFRPDEGQYGNNQCGDTNGYDGAYRAQNPGKLSGKIVRVNPETLALEIWTMVRGGLILL